MLISNTIFAQHKIRITGFVSDTNTGELLIGANIIEKGTTNGSASDNNGFFSIIAEVPATIQVSFIGYTTQDFIFESTIDTLIKIELSPGNQLDEVVIKSQTNPKFNVTKLSTKELCRIPSLSGKPDIAKGLQLMPGILSPNEGSSLLLVRGGDVGQNLYLFDNVPVIHVNHLGGFISVFNPDIINNLEIYKGGFPTKYGGRLSSIMNITQKEGDNSMFKGSFGIGLTDASLTLEGPLKLNNSSFIITARKTMIEGPYALLSKLAGDYMIVYGFHDINAKLSWKPDNKNSFNLNFYQGDDYLHYWVDFSNTKAHSGVNWGNWLGSFKWNRVISSKLFSTTSISYTRYRLRDKVNAENKDTANPFSYAENLKATVQDYSLRSGWQYKLLKNWSLDFGLQSSFLIHSPSIIFKSDQDVQPTPIIVNSSENAIYLENNIILWDKIQTSFGLRYVNYFTNGFYDFSLEPRLNFNYLINNNHTINASYMKASQYSHLIFTSGQIMNNELWIPSNSTISPSRTDQYTVGWQGNFYDSKFTAEINAYYKSMYNLATIKEGYTGILGDENWMSKIETGGQGTAKGLEFMVRKTSGSFTGFASYTLSNSTRQFANINNGNEYLFDYDRMHSFSINLNYKINEKININATWIYQTGLPYTPVLGKILIPNPDQYSDEPYTEAFIYGDRNSAKMRDSHRLDIGITYSKLTKRRQLPCEWTFSIYNVYNRQNPYTYFYGKEWTSVNPSDFNSKRYYDIFLYQRSYLPIIPSFSYKVYFNENTLKNENKLRIIRNQRKESALKEFDGSSYIKNRWDIKLGYALPTINYRVHHNVGWLSSNPHLFSLEANYGFSKYFTGGFLFSYSSFEYTNYIIDENTQTITWWDDSAKLISYNAKINFHLIPLLIKQKDSKFDLYLTAKGGGYYFKKNKFEYNAGLGMAVYPGKHFGFFGEYTYGNLVINNFNWRAGVVVRFRK